MIRRRVLLWGGKGAGKSGFLGALWHLDVDRAGAGNAAWAISPTRDVADRATREYLTSARQALIDEERRPTAPAAEYPILGVIVRKWVNGQPREALPLGFRDPAGEFADDAARAREQGALLLDDMVNAAGIIWLFDCTGQSQPEFTEVMKQLTSVRQRNQNRLVNTPLALCLSKIDQLDDAAMQQAQQAPRALLERVVGAETFDLFSRTFTNIEYFAISSKGCTKGEVEPIGLTGVLTWIHRQASSQERATLVKRYWKRAALALVALLIATRAYGMVDDYLNGAGRERREREEQSVLARLELAQLLYEEGATDSVLSVLASTELPKRHPRAIDLDTILALSAFAAGMAPELSDAENRPALTLARDRIDRALDNEQLTDSDTRARLRFTRANICIVLDCKLREIRTDLEFAMENTRSAELRSKAGELLEELAR